MNPYFIHEFNLSSPIVSFILANVAKANKIIIGCPIKNRILTVEVIQNGMQSKPDGIACIVNMGDR